MYEAFYGLKKKPFSMLPDPDFLFLSKKHQAALTLLEYGMLNHAGFCVISGEPGAGKTTVIRALLNNVGDDITVGLITNTHRSFGGLLDWILSAFNLHRPDMTQVEMHQAFMDFVISEYSKNRSVLLVVDEAQNMTADTLEELRMLSNVNSEKDLLMQIILAGQPALKEMLSMPELMQFAQRIAVDYHLDSLNLKETCGYIQHRLRVAGAERDVFTPAACERIHNYSGGTPRLINLLCETVMVYGFADQVDMIDVDLVDEMVQERMKDSVVPIVNRDIPKQKNIAASLQLEKDFPWISSPNNGAREDVQGDEPQVTAVPEEDRRTMENDGFQDDDIPVVDTVIETPSQDDRIQPEKDEVYAFEKIKEVETSIVEDATQEEAAQIEKNEGELSETTGYQSTENNPSASIEQFDSSADQTADQENRGTRRNLVKYGVISAVLGVTLIAAAVVLDYENKIKSDGVNSQLLELQNEELLIEAEATAEAAAKARAASDKARVAAEAEAAKARAEAEAAAIKAKAEAEKAKAAAKAEIVRARAEAARAKAAAEAAKAKAMAEAQAAARAKADAEAAKAKAAAEAQAAAKIKADLLKQQQAAVLVQQQAAALAKQEKDKRIKEQAEKLAAERAALAAQEAKKKRAAAEQERIARAKIREREAKLKADKVAEQERQRLFEQARIERQKRLEREAEARRLEQEWYEAQRQALLEAEAAQLLRLSE